jgi:hypothetical protein
MGRCANPRAAKRTMGKTRLTTAVFRVHRVGRGARPLLSQTGSPLVNFFEDTPGFRQVFLDGRWPPVGCARAAVQWILCLFLLTNSRPARFKNWARPLRE